MSPDETAECCGDADAGEWFDPTTEHCCPSGLVVGVSEACDAATCGGAVAPAEILRPVCCGGEDDGVWYDADFGAEQCCPDGIVVPGGEDCEVAPELCGDLPAPAEGAICCVGESAEQWVVAPSTCCGGAPADEGLECCGDSSLGVAFDPALERCCSPEEAYTAPIRQECEVVTVSCGGEAPDSDTSLCCGNSRTGAWYEPATHQCCDPGIALVLSRQENCPVGPPVCGGELLPLDAACCGSMVSGVAFDPETQTCCDATVGLVVPSARGCEAGVCDGAALGDGEECCGDRFDGVAYDPTAQQCCDSTNVIDAGEACPAPTVCGELPLVSGFACCGNELEGAAYDPRTQQCCDPFGDRRRLIGLGESCSGLAFGTWGFGTACGGDIYFADFSNGILKADGETLEVTLFAAAGFAVGSVCDGDALIYSDIRAGIFRKPLAGGDATLLTGDEFTQAFDLVLAGDVLVWDRNATLSDIWAYDISERSLVTIATNQSLPQHIATDGTWVYFTESSGFSPVVRRALITGDGLSAPETVMTELTRADETKELFVHGGTLYVVANGMGRIYARPADGTGSVTTFAPSETRPYGVTGDDTTLYWRDEFFGTIRAQSYAGGTARDLLTVTSGGGRGDVVVSGDYVYAIDTNAHTVTRVAR